MWDTSLVANRLIDNQPMIIVHIMSTAQTAMPHGSVILDLSP
jgi:hypothetical protein